MHSHIPSNNEAEQAIGNLCHVRHLERMISLSENNLKNNLTANIKIIHVFKLKTIPKDPIKKKLTSLCLLEATDILHFKLKKKSPTYFNHVHNNIPSMNINCNQSTQCDPGLFRQFSSY